MSDGASVSRGLLIGAALLAFCAAAALAIDVPLAAVFQRDNPLPGDFRKLVNLCEAFGHGLSVALILATMWALDPNSRRAIVRVAACAYGSGLAANIIKACVARVRPGHFDFHGGALATFEGVFPWWSNPEVWLQTEHTSFPSGHTATAVGLAIGLTWAYPRGKWLFAFFAGSVAMQRIGAGAHFLSDTFAGASVAMIHCAACLHPRVYGWLFDRFEGEESCSSTPDVCESPPTRNAA